jgi:kynurenine formamidase
VTQGDDHVELLGRRVRLVDLSHPLGPTASEPLPPRVETQTHQDGAAVWAGLYGIPPSALPGGVGFAGEVFDRLSTHAGTHVDAPWHYAPTAAGRPAPTIDEVPLAWCAGPLVVLDVGDLPTGHLVTADEIFGRLTAVGHELAAGDVVALYTGAERRWGSEEFWESGCGLGREAVLALLGRGVRAIGTDAWSLDRPYPLIGAQWRTHQDPAALWPAHFAGAERPYVQLEKLARLTTLPATGASLVAFPVKVAGGSGAWTRAVALVPDG